MPSPRLLYISGFLIDSGSTVSVVPPSCNDRHQTNDILPPLFAANGSAIKTFGTRIEHFKIMGRQCSHTMIIGDVICPILGIDFFSDGDGRAFLIDIHKHCLRDRETLQQARGASCRTHIHSLSTKASAYLKTLLHTTVFCSSILKLLKRI